MKNSIYDLKSNPAVRSYLIFKGRNAFETFSKLMQSDNLDNADLDNSVVVKALDELIQDEAKTFHLALPSGTKLYRCREITTAEQIKKGGIIAQTNKDLSYHTRGYNESNSKEAPFLKPRAARANIDGMSYLYLAEEPYTACSEIRPNNHSFVSIATFQLKKEANLIDFATNKKVDAFEQFERDNELSIAELFTEIMQRFGMPFIDKSIYRVTQFVADYIRKAGFDGIRYQSSMSAGKNITLFNSHKSRVEFIESHVILVNAQHVEIIDLETGKKIPEACQTYWKEEYLESAREELIRIVNQANLDNKII